LATEKTVEVRAPCDLEAGYEFFVSTGQDTSVRVRVPEGGAKKDQRFQAIVVSEPVSSGPHNIPYGRWRDGLCNCCAFGVFHPLLCLNIFCPICGLGQVLTRLKMDCFGSPRKSIEAASISTCMIMFSIAALYWIIQSIVRQSVVTLCQAFVALYTAAVTMRLRAYVRERYGIPEQRCVGCEDCCLSFWCLWCTVCQISRHTADFHKYPAGCCTTNGLRKGAPEVV
jgi:Cys-rich protein (TIGR01571 family)